MSNAIHQEDPSGCNSGMRSKVISWGRKLLYRRIIMFTTLLIALLTILAVQRDLPEAVAAKLGGRVTLEATIRHQVQAPPLLLSGKESSRFTEWDFSVYQKTNAALIRSQWVLMKALKEPRIAALSIVKRHEDPYE